MKTLLIKGKIQFLNQNNICTPDGFSPTFCTFHFHDMQVQSSFKTTLGFEPTTTRKV